MPTANEAKGPAGPRGVGVDQKPGHGPMSTLVQAQPRPPPGPWAERKQMQWQTRGPRVAGLCRLASVALRPCLLSRTPALWSVGTDGVSPPRRPACVAQRWPLSRSGV